MESPRPAIPCTGLTIQLSLANDKLRVDLHSIVKSELWRQIMFHILWYLIIGLLAGVIGKSIMHVHLSLMWTMILGVVGSLLGGGVSHIIFRARNERYHPAGLIFSTLGAILILFVCYKLNIHLPAL
jgi:uncharacterized membrane protein YeaQ/YmgE (transglycosylase-associated protein family)